MQQAMAAIEAGTPPEWTLRPPGRADGVIWALAWAWLGGESPLRLVELPPAAGS